MAGVIARFFQNKGFGFIKRPGGAPELFFHVSEVVSDQLQALEPGMQVSFDFGSNKRTGQPCAVAVDFYLP